MSEGRSDLGHVTCLFLSSQLGIMNLLATHGTHGCSRLAQSEKEKERIFSINYSRNKLKPGVKILSGPVGFSSTIYTCAGNAHHSDRSMCGALK